MNNFIFKSANRLIKNDSINVLGIVLFKVSNIQDELRHQRSEHKDIMLMLNKLLIDKHLQTQVDNYFEDEEETSPQTDSEEQNGST